MITKRRKRTRQPSAPAPQGNPFTNEYWRAEIESLRIPKRTHVNGHVRVDWFKIQGRCDDYLNVNMRFDDTDIPRLIVGKTLWFSLTPMEIQSAALALGRAHGKVAVLGLGLGYFAIRAADKPDVEEVIVFEQDPSVIEWFEKAYPATRRHKVKIVPGDARQTFRGYECDFCFADIYETMLGEETITDALEFPTLNKLERYHFWGMEKLVVEAVCGEFMTADQLNYDFRRYLSAWVHSPYDDKGTKLSDMARQELPNEFLETVVEQLSEMLN